MHPLIVLVTVLLCAGVRGAADYQPGRKLLQAPSYCRMVRDASSLNVYDGGCKLVGSLPRGAFVDWSSGERKKDFCKSGADMVKIKWGSGYAWTAASYYGAAYIAQCPSASNPTPFGAPAQSYRGMSAPFAPATARRWPLAQPFMGRPAVCYMNADGRLSGPGGSPPSCEGAATEFAALRKDSNTGKWTRFHNGLDLFAPTGTDVYATEDGTVDLVFAFNPGQAILVKHDSGVWVVYGEVSATVKNGARVKAGQKIGTVAWQSGSTMLHFETWSQRPEGGYCSSKDLKLCKGLINPTKYLLAAQYQP